MGKKVLKIIGVLLLVFIGILVAAPFFLEAKIGDIIKNNVNENVNATLDFSEANLSLISSFPNAEVHFQNLVLSNKAPFEGETLFKANDLGLTMGIMQLFKGATDVIAINDINIDGAFINITVDEAENANYDIAIPSETTEVEVEEEASEGFAFDLKSYEIINSKIQYTDKSTGMAFILDDIQHSGSGDLSLTTSELNTKTAALVSFEMDSVNYLNKNKILLDALVGIDLEKSKYSFLKNKAMINKLPLVFDGFVQLNDADMEVNLTFATPSSDFKNFLGLIPEAYSKDIAGVETTGDFSVKGNFNGQVDDIHIPKFNVEMKSNGSSFKYPDLPKAVENVFLDVVINNPSGITEDTFVDIKKASFSIDEDRFNLKSSVSDLMGNTKVKAHIDGLMHLANISKAYPVPEEYNLKGILTTDITTSFDMTSIEKEQYGKTETIGHLTVDDFEYDTEELAHPVKFKTANLTFNPNTVTLNRLKGATGTTDFDASGTIDNLLGFMFNDEKVKGDFSLNSNNFALNDFMVSETTAASEVVASGENTGNPSEEKIKIPSFLDATINAKAKKVLYDNIVLEDLSGQLLIKDQTATLNNMKSSLFGGQIGFNGEVSTKNEIPDFAMKLDLKQVGIQETFKSVELFKVLAPIAKILKGRLNTDISLSGKLDDELLPNLLSLSGDLFADIITDEVDLESSPLLNALFTKLKLVDSKKLDLDDLKTSLSFKDGVVTVKPFEIKYEDITVNVNGSHTFDNKLDYKASLDVPAKYLGAEINSLIARIDDSSLKNMTMPVTAKIGGLYNSPKVTTDLNTGVKQLTGKLIEVEKQKLIAKGTDKAKDLLGGLLGGSSTNKATDEKDRGSGISTKDQATDILEGLLGGDKKKDTVAVKKDSVPAKTEKDAVKDAAKDIIGGLFGKKKKDKSN